MLTEQLPLEIRRVLFATGNELRIAELRVLVKYLEEYFNLQYEIAVDASNPERIKPESKSMKPDEVALQKVVTIAQDSELFAADEGMTLIIGVDVVTILRGSDGEEKDLKRLSRNFNIDPNVSVEKQWRHVESVLRIAKADLIKRCGKPFTIVWNIGAAIHSTDGNLSSTCALVVEADFEGLTPDVIEKEFVIPDELLEMKNSGVAPTLELLKKVPGVDTGPRLPFAEYILSKVGEGHNLRVYNRDHAEEKYLINSKVFDKLIRCSVLPADVALQMLAGAYDPSLTPQERKNKPTQHLVFSSVVQ